MLNDISTKVNIKEVKKMKLCDVNEIEVNNDKLINANATDKNINATNIIHLGDYWLKFDPNIHLEHSKLKQRLFDKLIKMAKLKPVMKKHHNV